MEHEVSKATLRLVVRCLRSAAFALPLFFACGLLLTGASRAAGTSASSPQLGMHPPFRIAAVSILQYVQSQQLPSGRVRIVLSFSAPVQAHPATGAPTTNYVVQFLGATVSPTVPSVIPVNLPPIQSVNVSQFGNAVTVSVAMTAPVQARLVSASGNFAIIEVPQSGFQQPLPGAYQTTQPRQPQQAAPGSVQMHIVRLHYADVSEVVGILTGNTNISPSNVFNPQPTNIGQQGLGAYGQSTYGTFGQTIGQSIQPFQQFTQYQQNVPSEQQALGERISDNIAIDRRLNAIILTGTPDQIAQVEQLIAKIDVPVQSVLLDTQVLEVNETGEKSIGLPYNQSATSPISNIFNKQAQVLTNIPSQAVAGALAIQSDIWALVSTGKARVLASPKILTQDGLPASILTGDSLPIRITTPVGVGGVGAVSSQVEYINVGVNLQILPRVSGNGGVDANIYSQVSSVTGFDSSGDPQISTRQAQTKVNLMEGQTLVIGGLLQQRDIRNLQKVWLLGDIPLLGYLFRFYTETKQDTNLVITVTPHVVPAPNAAGSGQAGQGSPPQNPQPPGASPGPPLQ